MIPVTSNLARAGGLAAVLAAAVVAIVLPGGAAAQLASPVTIALEINGLTVGYFSEVENLGWLTDLKPKANGSVKVGALQWPSVTLKRGVTASRDLWDWRQQAIDGGPESAQRAVKLTLYDQAFNAVAAWLLDDAWPSKISVAVEAGAPIERLELTHRRVVREM